MTLKDREVNLSSEKGTIKLQLSPVAMEIQNTADRVSQSPHKSSHIAI